MSQLMPILIKLIVGFAGLWAMTRLLGKKEISQLTPFDFISAIIMSELVGNTIYDDKVYIWMLLFALAVWALLSFAFEKLTEYGKPLRKPLEGKPELLIVNGELDMAALRRNSLEFDQLRMMMRQKDIFSLGEVAYAIYETNGSLSILKKSAYESVRRSDLDLKTGDIELPRSLVEDGVTQREALAAIGKDEAWLHRKLQEIGFPDPRSVAYAEWTGDGELKAIRRWAEPGPKPETRSV